MKFSLIKQLVIPLEVNFCLTNNVTESTQDCGKSVWNIPSWKHQTLNHPDVVSVCLLNYKKLHLKNIKDGEEINLAEYIPDVSEYFNMEKLSAHVKAKA